MIRYSIFLGLIALCTSLSSHAQNAYFPTKGIITFEKEVYIRARMREMTNKMGKQNPGMMMRFGGSIDDMPEKSSSLFTMYFDEDETLMQSAEDQAAGTTGRGGAGRGGAGRGSQGMSGNTRSSSISSGGATITINHGGFGGGSRGNDKIMYQNLKEQVSEVAMELDEKIILKDSLQQITWRFTNEYRNIAGYECRRVNGATADSLYVIAFYSDQIPLSAGPALISGLPGMVLGLVIPEMHINYWARNVEFTVDNVPSQWRDKKSKPMSMQDFLKTMGNNRFFGGGAAAGSSQLRRNLLENLIY